VRADTELMAKHYARRVGAAAVPYRIVTRGRLEEPLAGPLERMTIESVEGDTVVLVVEIMDQAQLQGAIRWLSDLGLEIMSVNPLEE
jgi:hypothetical protein